MGLVALPSSGRVYVDTNIFIYTVERMEPYRQALEPFWRNARDRSVGLVTSSLTLMECLAGPHRAGDGLGVAKYRAAILGYRPLGRVPISDAVLETAARMRGAHGFLRTPDALHAATALLENCDWFLTNDHRLARLTGIKVVLMDHAVGR